MSFALILLSITAAATTSWQHPAGMITEETLAEIHQKVETQPWARDIYDLHKRVGLNVRMIHFIPELQIILKEESLNTMPE